MIIAQHVSDNIEHVEQEFTVICQAIRFFAQCEQDFTDTNRISLKPTGFHEIQQDFTGKLGLV